jgi:hypothetical protein
VFFVRSTAIIPCPCCAGELYVMGSRPRLWVLNSGERRRLIIRRMRCTKCHKIHHELPDLLVPYKHYDAQSIEGALADPTYTDVAADESTILRWLSWFTAWSVYASGVLTSLSLRFNLPVVPSSASSQSVLQILGRFVGMASGLLARAVRPIANSHAWVTDPVCLFVR